MSDSGAIERLVGRSCGAVATFPGLQYSHEKVAVSINCNFSTARWSQNADSQFVGWAWIRMTESNTTLSSLPPCDYYKDGLSWMHLSSIVDHIADQVSWHWQQFTIQNARSDIFVCSGILASWFDRFIANRGTANSELSETRRSEICNPTFERASCRSGWTCQNSDREVHQWDPGRVPSTGVLILEHWWCWSDREGPQETGHGIQLV